MFSTKDLGEEKRHQVQIIFKVMLAKNLIILSFKHIKAT